MPYQTFTFDKLESSFDLHIEQANDLYGDVKAQMPSPLLTETLKRYEPFITAKIGEKMRSELFVAPILFDVRELLNHKIMVFSGIKFNVSREDDLYGYCDFLISQGKLTVELKAPVVAVVEAKKEDLTAGIPQCIAEMVAVQRFNQEKQQAKPTTYGVITSGTDWRFLQLEGKEVTLDQREYPITELPQILGILTFMAS